MRGGSWMLVTVMTIVKVLVGLFKEISPAWLPILQQSRMTHGGSPGHLCPLVSVSDTLSPPQGLASLLRVSPSFQHGPWSQVP